MSIAAELPIKLNNNQHAIYITDTDDLLAAWQFQRKSPTTRSKNMSLVPKEWRYSVSPNEKSPLMPCHVSYRRKAGQSFSTVKPASEYSTRSCHHPVGGTSPTPVPDLNALDAVTFAKRNMAPYISPIIDTATLALVCKDLGITGRAIPKVINGRRYIAFVEMSGSRTMFPGTLYSANNRKIIKMAIGALGIKNMVKNGGIITICITVPLTILECYLKNPHSLAAFVGNLASDLIKIGIPALMGAIFGLAVGSATTIVFLPIAVAIGISVSAGWALNYIDDRYQLTGKLVAALEKLGQEITEKQEQIQQSLSSAPHKIERDIIWRTFGYDIVNPSP